MMRWPAYLGLLVLSWLTGCTAQQIGNPDWEAEPVGRGIAGAESPAWQPGDQDQVAWQAWSVETLAMARRLDRPLLVSVGFSASYWCQRMQQQCYRDTAIAELMNQAYLPVLIDREARPDLAASFIRLCQQQGEACTWPLQVILTPQAEPVQVLGFMEPAAWREALLRFDYLFHQQPKAVRALIQPVPVPAPATPPGVRLSMGPEQVADLMEEVQRSMDLRHGGVAGPGKHLRPDVLHLLLHDAVLRDEATSRSLVLLSLDRMADGAIYDHLGGGFFRLSSDAAWRRPQFEKLLADQAQMVMSYARGFQLTGRSRYEEVIYETLGWVQTTLRGESGGYLAALAADSEGEAGRYYLWPRIELDGILGPESEVFAQFYNLTDEGNWGRGQSIPYRTVSDTAFADLADLSLPVFQDRLTQMRARMLAARQRRLLPRRDGKQLTAWNALMTSAWVAAYQALRDPALLRAAIEGGEYLSRSCRRADGELVRYRLAGEGQGAGFLSDYAYTARAWLDLYQATLDPRWVRQAAEVTAYAVTHFYDAQAHRLAFTTQVHRPGVGQGQAWPLPGELPDPGATMGQVLLDLDHLLGKPAYREAALALLRHDLAQIRADPVAQASGTTWLLHYASPRYRLLLPELLPAPQWQRMQRHFLPQVLALHGTVADAWWARRGEAPPDSGWWLCHAQDCERYLEVETVLSALRQRSRNSDH